MNAVDLAQALIRAPSVTPADAGAIPLLKDTLEALGFACTTVEFTEPGTAPVLNLYARRGKAGRNFCFAGHTDVVPPGNRDAWSLDPFGGIVRDGRLYGRGAVDMKGAIACFVAAVAAFEGARDGSISLVITGDEEAVAINGTRKLIDWLGARGERLDACIVGEPTSAAVLGDMVKIGRRGSLNGYLTVHGVQGHTAYPHLADNAAHRLVAMLQALVTTPLDAAERAFPGLDTGDLDYRHRQSHLERHSRHRARGLQCPLQRCLVKRHARALAARRARSRGRALRSRDQGQRRIASWCRRAR